MRKSVIDGPCSLRGEVAISGAKNSALKLMAASLLVPGEVVLEGVPRITDVSLMVSVLEKLGAKVSFEANTLKIDASGELSEET
ncbi:MAG: UDP-N-acetylglucosamine 1-carboxyvinyltransferase, partial [Actinomycetota bacterium]